jgi:hypothetical protein
VYRVLTVLLAALALAPSAFAGGPNPAGFQGGVGALTPGSPIRYVALGSGADTVLAAVGRSDGVVLKTLGLFGSWGIPRIGTDAVNGSISRDGRTLVLAGTGIQSPSNFTIVDTQTLKVRDTVRLQGQYAFDALSPDGMRMYLIQYAAQDNSRYVVRAYDLGAHKLLPGRIADRTQKSWIMQGFANARTMSSDGRWVYTLYINPTGYPFVHALDTVNGVAHCTGVPWTGSNTEPWKMRLALRDGGHRLAVNWVTGGTYLSMDTSTWKLSYAHPGGFPWLWVGLGAGAGAALLAVAALLLRRRRRPRQLEVAVGAG